MLIIRIQMRRMKRIALLVKLSVTLQTGNAMNARELEKSRIMHAIVAMDAANAMKPERMRKKSADNVPRKRMTRTRFAQNAKVDISYYRKIECSE